MVRRKFNRRARFTLSGVEGCHYKSPGQGPNSMNNYDFAVAEIEVSYSHRIPARERIKITGSKDAFDVCSQFWPGLDHVEYFYILFMNRNNQLLGVHQVSKGGFTGTVIDVRVIFQVALKACATSIIAVHNHPSGSLNPSDADQQITQKIKEAGKLLDIQLLDSLIITSERYFSFADEGLL
jgi:DNA repair protein RadC